MTKVKSGDIFCMYLTSCERGFGQVIEKIDKNFFIVIFDHHAKEGKIVPVNTFSKKHLLFGGITLPLFFNNRRWKIVARGKPVLTKSELPKYLLDDGSTNNKVVIDFYREQKGIATSEDEKNLDYREEFSPMTFQEALAAHFKFEPWLDFFDGLKIDKINRMAKVNM